MNNFEIKPTVDETQEFIEIANDFSNPLDLVREAISNSFDAFATKIYFDFSTVEEFGKSISHIKIHDNGEGMDRDGLQAFFDLGNSLRRGDPNYIGEKGHGTKVFFNSSSIDVITIRNGIKLTAFMDEPYRNLYNRKIPIVTCSEEKTSALDGTEILIKGYNNNQRDKFTHAQLKDYILWFTKFGSIERVFNPDTTYSYNKLYLKGLDRDEYEELVFGHYFPDDSPSADELFNLHTVKAPDYYSKKIIKTGSLRNHPEISYQAVFSIEGKRVKYDYNQMLRRPGFSAPRGAYTIQDRYGLYLCKDYIPVQRKNVWITTRGSEFTKFHAFINCQNLRLTANRGSVDNTPAEIIQDIRYEVSNIYKKILESEDWRILDWLEEEARAYNTSEKEKRDFEWRVKKSRKSNVVTHKGVTLVEPQRESGVFALLLQLSIVEPDLFPFEVVDYDTHSGLDVIVKGDHSTPIQYSKLYYLELKHYLSSNFNHSFENLHSIVCWDTEIKDGDIVRDIANEERKMNIIIPDKTGDYTKYFLDQPKKVHKIEVYVLKDYLSDKLGLEFRPRSHEEI